MKLLLLLTFTFCVMSSPLKADVGNCVVYRAAFYLKNETIFYGCFEFGGYSKGASLDEHGINDFCNNEGVFRLFKEKQRTANFEQVGGFRKSSGKVTIYKAIHSVQMRPVHERIEDEMLFFGFVTRNDIESLDSSDISKMIFLSAEYSKREWSTEIIVGSAGMFDTLLNRKYFNCLFSGENDTAQFQNYQFLDNSGGYALYNYNPKINATELKRLALLYVPVDEAKIAKEIKLKYHVRENFDWPPGIKELYENAVTREIKAVKQWFWGKGIVVIDYLGNC